MIILDFKKTNRAIACIALFCLCLFAGNFFKIDASVKTKPAVACDFYKINSQATLDVKSNDTDVEDHELITTVSPKHGTLAYASGYYFYNPNQGFEGTDEFAYKGCQNDLCTDSAVVTITVQHAGFQTK